jgi:hypothetical protein
LTHGTDAVMQLDLRWDRFVLATGAPFEAGGFIRSQGIAGLHQKAFDGTVEGQSIIKAAVTVVDEVVHRLRGIIREQLDHDRLTRIPKCHLHDRKLVDGIFRPH